MIAYNTQWLDALSVKEQAGKWYKKGLITQPQWQEIQARFVSGFYSPNFFVRIGLFFFCWILTSSTFGLIGVSLISAISDDELGAGIVLLLFSGLLFFALERFIKDQKYYCAGIDDALLYMALSSGIGGLCLCFEPFLENHVTLYLLLSLPILIMAAIRYTDMLLTCLSYLCAMGILFLVAESNNFTRIIISFLCMLFSGAVYIIIRKNKAREELRFWADCLMIIEACSLITFYLSGNYFVVKELGESLFPGYTIPLAFLFYVFTAIMPLVYVFVGLKNKDRLILRIGLIMVAVSVLTFKYYFSLGHHEITLTIAGAIMVAVAYLAIRILKKNVYGLTYKEDLSSEDSPGYFNAEALLVAQTFGPQLTPEKEFEFGNGKFGGGGAGGNY